jgi:hypothetical protein
LRWPAASDASPMKGKQKVKKKPHAAIDNLHKGEFECAITLGGAAEGVLPDTDKPHLFQKIKKMADTLPTDPSGATKVNALTNWAKHGTHETATISEQDAIEVVTRAISKFIAVYGEQSKEMKTFSEWAMERLQAGENPDTV